MRQNVALCGNGLKRSIIKPLETFYVQILHVCIKLIEL